MTNVAAFGAFVDIGVHQDGLVHVSQLADRFVKDPHEVVKAGDVVKVRVVEVDIPRKRIGLSMRREPAGEGGASAGARKQPGGGRGPPASRRTGRRHRRSRRPEPSAQHFKCAEDALIMRDRRHGRDRLEAAVVSFLLDAATEPETAERVRIGIPIAWECRRSR